MLRTITHGIFSGIGHTVQRFRSSSDEIPSTRINELDFELTVHRSLFCPLNIPSGLVQSLFHVDSALTSLCYNSAVASATDQLQRVLQGNSLLPLATAEVTTKEEMLPKSVSFQYESTVHKDLSARTD